MKLVLGFRLELDKPCSENPLMDQKTPCLQSPHTYTYPVELTSIMVIHLRTVAQVTPIQKRQPRDVKFYVTRSDDEERIKVRDQVNHTASFG